jgi:hypothetical protein
MGIATSPLQDEIHVLVSTQAKSIAELEALAKEMFDSYYDRIMPAMNSIGLSLN